MRQHGNVIAAAAQVCRVKTPLESFDPPQAFTLSSRLLISPVNRCLHNNLIMRSGSATLRRCCVNLRVRELTQLHDGVQTGTCQYRVCSCYAACMATHSMS